jgi:hypothetical protein
VYCEISVLWCRACFGEGLRLTRQGHIGQCWITGANHMPLQAPPLCKVTHVANFSPHQPLSSKRLNTIQGYFLGNIDESGVLLEQLRLAPLIDFIPLMLRQPSRYVFLSYSNCIKLAIFIDSFLLYTTRF